MNSIALRQDLHQNPELAGQEFATSGRLRSFLQDLAKPPEFVDLGAAAFAAVFDSGQAGPTVMLRSELDALPIDEPNGLDYRSTKPGIAHKCGHDGHMAILAETARLISSRPLAMGRMVLLFQPAEETGEGAKQIIANPAFGPLAPDRIFALHNVPGFAQGQVVTRAGTFSCASRGMQIEIQGLAAHAAQPETGVSPAMALSGLLNDFCKLTGDQPGICFATVTHARMGTRSFGIAPGSAELLVTLRSECDDQMAKLVARAESLVQEHCDSNGLRHLITYTDEFPATVNDSEAVVEVQKVARADELSVPAQPFRWSEDFGHFTARYPGAMFGLGAGEDMLPLHHPEYDFPDTLIDRGAELFERLVRLHCGSA